MATAVSAAAAQGYAASPQPPAAASGGGARGLTPMKLLHLRFVCGVATDAEVPPIWREVAQAPTKGASLSILNQYLWAGREVCRRQFLGAAEMHHVRGAEELPPAHLSPRPEVYWLRIEREAPFVGACATSCQIGGTSASVATPHTKRRLKSFMGVSPRAPPPPAVAGG